MVKYNPNYKGYDYEVLKAVSLKERWRNFGEKNRLCVYILALSALLAVGLLPWALYIGCKMGYPTCLGDLLFQCTWTLPENHINDGVTCSGIPEDARFDCWPTSTNVTKEECTAKQCCWAPVEKGSLAPTCFYPSGYQVYNVIKLEKRDTSYYLALERQTPSGWPYDIVKLAVDISMETRSRLHVKIYDPFVQRYEVPLKHEVPPKVTKTPHSTADVETDYDVDIPASGPFYVSVTRRSTGQVLFSTKNAAPLIFSDQYLQIGTKLSSKFIYGLGEHADRFLLDTHWNRKVLWARDQGPNPNPRDRDDNLYGVHPFYLNMETEGNAHGVFLLNSNAMEIELQTSPHLTFRTIGGVLDFYVFSGPTSDNVVEQYTDFIGRPFMPPYWALGFHLSRYGYGNAQNLTKVVERMRAANMYYDAQWTDIDAMRAHLDWTYDAEGNWKGLDQVVKDLHDHGQRYNILIDPIMSINQSTKTYQPYPDGLKDNVYVKAPNGTSNLIGMGWPGQCVWVDFFHPNATSYWTKQAQKFYDEIPFDAILIDMNEPSNFGAGSVDGCPKGAPYENPPFIPRGLTSGTLQARTVCMTAKQYLSSHYNLHSLYGHSESIVTKRALDSVLKKRSIVITRSSYAGTGVHAGHWSGDISSTWAEMNYTIPGMLNFQMFGVPLWGADICGFGGNTTPELCTRWTQLGVFYPFMWNHNRITQKDQDPASFEPDVQDRMRKALEMRYYVIPYLYTLFYRTHVDGTPIVRPVFFQYPNTNQNETYYINEQFMWGSTLLVTPVLQENVTEVKGYLPKDRWYDQNTHTYMDSPGEYVIFHIPLDQINVQIRGGSIIPMQFPEVTTTLSRKNQFILQVALAPDTSAHGELFWDDGESLDSITNKKYNLITFDASKDMLWSTVVKAGYKTTNMTLGQFVILGVESKPTTVTLNGETVQSYKYMDKELHLVDLTVDLLQSFRMAWM